MADCRRMSFPKPHGATPLSSRKYRVLWSLVAAPNQESSNADRMTLERTTNCSRRTAGKDKCRRACDPVLPPTPALLQRSGAFRGRSLAPRDRFHGRVGHEKTGDVTWPNVTTG